MTRSLIIAIAAMLALALINAVVIGAVVNGYVSIELEQGSDE